MRIGFKLFILISGIFIFAGCATSRGYIKLEMPPIDSTAKIGKQVLIRSVNDNREFQDNPASPDIPSLGFGWIVAQPDVKSTINNNIHIDKSKVLYHLC